MITLLTSGIATAASTLRLHRHYIKICFHKQYVNHCPTYK